jgi:flagellar hook assembly protein FlgD
VPHTGPVSLVVYNVLGQQVRTLVNGVVAAGYHTAVWDSKNDRGQTMESGVYFYRLQFGSMSIVKKMLLIK